MQFVEGRIFRDTRMDGLPAEDKKLILLECARVLAQLHSLDYSGIKNSQRERDYYQRQIHTWTRQYKLSETNHIAAVEDLILWLPHNIVKHPHDSIALCHGDFSISNIIFHPTLPKILAVLDWELSTTGQSFADLGYFLQFYHQTPMKVGANNMGIKGIDVHRSFLLGYPPLADIMKEYFQARINQEIEVDLSFPLIFSQFRLTSIAQGVYKRSLDGNASQKKVARQFLQIARQLSSDAMDIVMKFTNNDPFKIKQMSEQDKEYWGHWQVSDRAKSIYYAVKRFVNEEINPQEQKMIKFSKDHPWQVIPQIEELKQKAQNLGLWNLFCAYPIYGKGLTNLEYAFVCEIMGSNLFAPEIFNCSAPDTGNMELLILYANQAQKQKYLVPLLKGEIRSCFAMTEPHVASSDASNIQCTIKKTERGYLVNGRKWYISGAGDPRCKFAILMGKTDPEQSQYKQQSMVIVDLPHPNVKIVRAMEVFHMDDAPHGHMEMEFKDVLVPFENLIWEEGRGFQMAQGRLGGGRLHHCMRLIGLCRRAIEMMKKRAHSRVVFKRKLWDYDSFQQTLGQLEITQSSSRLMVLNAASLLDRYGNKSSNTLKALSECKAYVPKKSCEILDSVIQVFGAEGLSQDQILTIGYSSARSLRIADGPDEVHVRQVAKFSKL